MTRSIAPDDAGTKPENASYAWKPITDLPPNWQELAESELRPLERIWGESRDDLAGPALRRFNERLCRQMAIETGILERVYTLDRGTTELLIEQGIDAALIPRESTNEDPDVVAATIQDQHDAVEGLFAFVKHQRQLSTGYIKELHAALMRHQETTTAMDSRGKLVTVPLERGRWKVLPNNPRRPNGTVHEYCPPEQVASEMDQLVRRHVTHQAERVMPEVEAAWLHHRFTQIHPFQDGNGRVARCLASLVFIRAGWFPLSVTRDDREAYISALERADYGDLASLIALFSKRERNAFRNALTVAEDVKRSERVDHVIAATRRDLERRRDAMRREWDAAKATAGKLQRFTEERLGQVATELKTELRSLEPSYRFHVGNEPPDGERAYWFRHQIIETAHTLHYFADVATYRAWASLILWSETRAELVVSFHGMGREFRGLLAVSAFFFRREETEDGDREVVDLTPLTNDVFQINYVEDGRETLVRFERWLDEALIRGLENWRRGL